MNLTLKRFATVDERTFGMLYVNGKSECFTLEDAIRDVKIPKKTCIPAGTYEIVINWSERWKRQMPLLICVPNFSGIRLHPGNTIVDTEGCILVGRGRTDQYLSQSRAAFDTLYPRIELSSKVERVMIDIINP